MKNVRKRLTALGLVSVMAFSLIGCGSSNKPASTDSAAAPADQAESQAPSEASSQVSQEEADTNATGSGETAEIEWLHIWPEYDAIWKEAIADFESKNPDVKIKEIAISWDKLSNSLQTYFSAGDAPDIMATWSTGKYKSMDVLLDLTPYLDADGGSWKNQYAEASLGVGKVGESYYSVPLRATATLLMYNKTLMEENGWEEPKTFEEFETLMGEIKKAGLTPLVCPGNPEGYQIAAIGNNFAEHALYKSGKLESTEYLTGHLSDLGDEYTYAAKKLREWYDNGWIDSSAPGMTREEAQQSFYTQKGVFFFSNNNEYSTHQEAAGEAGFELGFMAMPAPEGVPTIVNNYGADMWMVYGKTEYPEACVKWLQYLGSDEFMQKFADETASVVGNQNVKYSDEVVQKFSDIFSSVKCYRINPDYIAGDTGVKINMEFINYLLEPGYTPEKMGQFAADAWAEEIDENAN